MDEQAWQRSQLQSRLFAALAIASGITVLEVLGGILSNSLALLSDAGHIFADAFGLGTSIFALRIASRPHTQLMTYGFHRAEVLAAFINGGSLIVVSVYIFYDAYRRFLEPPPIQAPLMVIVAFLGLVANLVSMIVLSKQREESLSIRAAFLHTVGDALSTAGVVVGGLLVILTRIVVVDPIVGALIGFIILRSALNLTRDSAEILLERAPKHLKLEEIATEIRKFDGVLEVHDLHVWTITSGFYALSGHVTVRDQLVSQADKIISEINRNLSRKFKIRHSTLQTESEQSRIVRLKSSPESET